MRGDVGSTAESGHGANRVGRRPGVLGSSTLGWEGLILQATNGPRKCRTQFLQDGPCRTPGRQAYSFVEKGGSLVKTAIVIVSLAAELLALSQLFCTPAKAQNREQSSRCLSISDVNQRVECLEGRLELDKPTTNAPLPASRTIAPSFDCTAARDLVERVICSDAVLAQWDAQMGQLYRRALSIQNASSSLVENQRRWLVQRSSCQTADIESTKRCLIEVTRQRAARAARTSLIAGEACCNKKGRA